MKAVALRANEINISSNYAYFIENAEKLTAPDYVVTPNDLLLCRNKTTGVSELSFRFKTRDFSIIDVGGQRSERRKWIHSFENVNLLLFFTSLSEYDQKLEEDPRVNRMNESLRLFGEIVNSKWFATVPLALILNKRDIFKEKLPQRELKALFPEYEGGPDYDLAIAFIKGRFLSLIKTERTIFTHVTCATDTNCIGDVFADLASSILVSALSTL